MNIRFRYERSFDVKNVEAQKALDEILGNGGDGRSDGEPYTLAVLKIFRLHLSMFLQVAGGE